ncbi:uncharacterized protein H6S33_001814 [Morchella sextelata]|uniref:uncharacterized protein n=1 Tax=Morchella sextelata TaxID=1174677 RepID=UPI001D03836C|nr:uncharacterized protein H6S33_001814 [Morchella sextelata]KAH0608680.1 hypothetical protein H6S33_001814 [Morchella sextelata]
MNLELEKKIWPWIRDCAYDIGYTKDNVFVGQAMFIENCIASFTAALNMMIDNGLIQELQKECITRVSKGENGGEAIEGVTEIIFPLGSITLSSLQAEAEAPKCSCSGVSLPEKIGSDPSTVRRYDFSKINLELPEICEVPTHTFFFQHQVLTSAQSTLESACYRFTKKNYPSILTRNKWRCPEAGELTAWTKELIRAFEADPGPATKDLHSPTKFPKVLRDLAELRHTTVHRLAVSGEKLLGLLENAFNAVKMFKDNKAINAIALLFHGHGDCLTLGQKILYSRARMLEELGTERKRAKKLLGKCEWQSFKVEERGGTAYENFLEDQLDWMCKGSSRKSLEFIVSEFWEMVDEQVVQ